MRRLIFPLLGALALAGCSSSSGPAGGGDSFAADIQPIFDLRCAGCHGGNGGLDLSPGLAYGNLVSVQSQGYAPMMRVQPGDPENSVLYGKVSGSTFGDRMPLGQEPLTAGQIESIRAWIAAGALND